MMTVNEFWTFSNRPENGNRPMDLIQGEIVEWPLAYSKHGVVCARVGFLLDNSTQRTQHGFVTTNNAGVIFPGPPPSVIGPDVAFYTSFEADDPLTGWSNALP